MKRYSITVPPCPDIICGNGVPKNIWGNGIPRVPPPLHHWSLVTGRICLRQLCRYCFYSRANLQGRHVEQIQVNSSSLPNLTLICPGVGFTAPKTEKMEFYQYNCP